MARVFIHIGSPKTGTSAIQNFLHRNRAELRRGGTLYPADPYYKAAQHTLGAVSHPGRTKRLAESREVAFDRAVATIFEEIEEAKPDRIILSTEYLWGKLPDARLAELIDAFGDFRVTVVVYLRRQDDLAQSLYLQSLKSGNAEAFEPWLRRAEAGDKAGFHYDRVLAQWAAVVAEIAVRAYDLPSVKADLCGDFLDAVGHPDSPRLKRMAGQTNITPGPRAARLLRAINEIWGKEEIGKALRKIVIGGQDRAADDAPASLFRPGERQAFMDRYRPGNAALAKLYRADHAELLASDEAGSRQPLDEVSDRDVLDYVVRSLPALLNMDQTRKGP